MKTTVSKIKRTTIGSLLALGIALTPGISASASETNYQSSVNVQAPTVKDDQMSTMAAKGCALSEGGIGAYTCLHVNGVGKYPGSSATEYTSPGNMICGGYTEQWGTSHWSGNHTILRSDTWGGCVPLTLVREINWGTIAIVNNSYFCGNFHTNDGWRGANACVVIRH